MTERILPFPQRGPRLPIADHAADERTAAKRRLLRQAGARGDVEGLLKAAEAFALFLPVQYASEDRLVEFVTAASGVLGVLARVVDVSPESLDPDPGTWSRTRLSASFVGPALRARGHLRAALDELKEARKYVADAALLIKERHARRPWIYSETQDFVLLVSVMIDAFLKKPLASPGDLADVAVLLGLDRKRELDKWKKALRRHIKQHGFFRRRIARLKGGTRRVENT